MKTPCWLPIRSGARRSAGPRTAIVGGRALVGAAQRLGAMFGPARSGPNPFDLVPLIGPQSDRNFTDLARGPVDVPQRGAYIVAASFLRSLAGTALDPVLLHLDLAVQARMSAWDVACEPSLTFNADEDSLELRRALGICAATPRPERGSRKNCTAIRRACARR